MNSFFCWLTGGHKYADCNLITEQCPDDVRKMFVSNHCVKCGTRYFGVMDIDRVIQEEIAKRSDNNAR